MFGLAAFQGCTLTKVLLASSGLSTWLCLSPVGGAASQHLCQSFPVSSLAYPSYPSLLIGSVCLLAFRQLERYLGSRKYGAAVLLLLSLVHVLKTAAFTAASTGPIAVVAALGLLYLQYVPSGVDVSLFGVRFSEHVWVPASLVHLLLAGGALPQDAFTALATALVWTGGFSRACFPSSIARALQPLGDLLSTPLGPVARGELAPTASAQQPGRVRQASGAGARYAEQLLGAGGRQRRQRPPTQDNIAALVAMGFPQESARWALTQTGNDLQAAVELLTTAAR